MNTRQYSAFLLAVLCASLAPPLQAQDCDFKISVTTGCNADGTGWTIVTTGYGEGKLEYHWDGNEAMGGPQMTGLTNGSHYVSVSDGLTCETVVAFDIDCPVAPPINCQFRTQTQGGWGSPGNGNSPGAYRNAHFAAAFPNGLEIGCTNKLRLTSAAAVQAFLPSGTTARALNAGTIVNPGQSYKNVLAGQLVALTLSVRFDAMDPAFGASSMGLGSAIIQSGTFQGYTVQELLYAANQFIGGCPSAFTASQLNAALSAVNECFVDGTASCAFVGCTPPSKRLTFAKAQALMYPVPANDRLLIDWPAGDASRIELHDATGRLACAQAVASNERLITVPTSHLPDGAYIVRVIANGNGLTQRISIVH